MIDEKFSQVHRKSKAQFLPHDFYNIFQYVHSKTEEKLELYTEKNIL